MKKLPRGLTFDKKRERYRVQIKSAHTNKGKMYSERLPEGTTRRQAEAYLGKLREDDRLERLVWPGERQSNERPQRWTVGDFVSQMYMPYCAARNKASTLARKKYQFHTLAPTFWDLPLDGITREDIVNWQAERKLEGIRAHTINGDLKLLYNVLVVAHELGELPHAPQKFPQLPISDRKQKRALTQEEAQIAIDQAYAVNATWGAVALFLLHTGARWGETRQLAWESVDLEKGRVKFEAFNAKQDRDRELPLHQDLIEALCTLPRAGDLVFCWNDGKMFPEKGRLKRRSGTYAWGEFGPHIWRHTFATWKLRAGVPIALVSRWLGHASIQMTVDIYGHIDGGEHKEEIMRGPRVEVRKLRIVGRDS